MGDYSSILATAERMADGVATPEEVAEAQRVAQVALDQEPGARHWLAEVARKTVAPEPVDAAFAFTSANEFLRDVGEPHDNEGHATFLRDIFGNPFIKPQFKKKWRTDIAFALASQMYDSGDFSAMPILADALQDAGCDNDDILNHCRGPGPHVRGCWVVDLVLRRE